MTESYEQSDRSDPGELNARETQDEFRRSNAEPDTASSKRPTFVVGIGASAGGLESLEKLFRQLPDETGMAFVVLQHLSPDFKSMMDELLARDTNMLIHRVEDGMPVQANRIYLLPPKKEMIIAEGRLHLEEKDPHRGLALPIDHFFESLARECGSRAVGIVLSGSGSDGSRGVVEIARRGGFVISETTASAKFDSMPISAQASGSVDLILAAEEIGPTLARFANAPDTLRNLSGPRSKFDPAGPQLQGIEAIYELFRETYNIDFSGYRDTTIVRRINRRLALLGIADPDHYVQRLIDDPVELEALFEDLLIGVTEFFRDGETFEFLGRNVLPGLVQAVDHDRAIRMWVAGCATGEEAYSIAILLTEVFERLGKTPKFKLFATDIHKTSLGHAGRGIYSEEAVRGLSEARRERFFVRRPEGFQIAQEIRQRIVFSPHNLLCDAPFTDLDFVSCRNLLIYFQPEAQRRAMTMFHYALWVGGVLLLGGSETPGELSSEFDGIEERMRLFRKRRQVRLDTDLRASVAGTGSGKETLGLHTVGRKTTRSYSPTAFELQPLYNQLLHRFMPPGLLVDENRQLVDSFGGAERMLRLPSRGPSLDVLDLLDQHLRTTLTGAIVRASKEQTSVRYGNVSLQLDESQRSYELTVSPLKTVASNREHFLITFQPIGVTRNVDSTGSVEGRPPAQSRLEEVEEELRYSKENLQATIEELETSNEELQATNEELIASNEELQSTNEELHSVNEELYTVNAEHQRKIGELAELNRDMNHLLENTDVATVFLDKELRIRRFTSRIRKLYDLIDQDIGRPLTSFSSRFPIAHLEQRLRDVLRSGNASEWEVRTEDRGCYLLRLLPYRTNEPSIAAATDNSNPDSRSTLDDDSGVEGVVLMFLDVSSLEDLRGRLRWMSAIVASTDDAIIGQDLEGRITSWNTGAEALYQYAQEEAIGQHISMLIPPDQRDESVDYLRQIRAGRRPENRDTVRVRKDGKPIHVSLTISPVHDADRRVIGISKIARDITSRVEMEERIREQIRQREQFLAMLSHELRNPLGAVLNAGRLLQDDRIDDASRKAAAMTVERQVALMRALLNDLLDVSRISLGKIELKRERIDLRDLLPAIRETTGPVIEKHDGVLRIEVDDEPLPVDGDPTRLVQIHVNLIHNAAKYSPPGSEILVSLTRRGDTVVIAIVDTGVGISPDFLPKLFEPFAQLEPTVAQSDGGLGVGLALVKTLVELHGGEIELKSEGRNLGTTAVVRLPLNAAELGAPAAPVAPDLPAVPTESTPLRIVLVEDLEDSRNTLRMLLELEGHDVIAVADGEQGLDAFREHRPHLGLVDIGLPGIDGYEVARSLRREFAAADLMLVALTGFGQASDVKNAQESGFDEHLVKPVVPEQLDDLIARCAARSVTENPKNPS